MAVFVIDGVVSLRETDREALNAVEEAREWDVSSWRMQENRDAWTDWRHDHLLCEYPDGFWDDVSEEDTLLQQATDSHSDMGSGCPGNDMLI